MNNQTINNWENDMNEKKLREDMCEIARMMYDKKLICGPAGNISARLDNGLFLITPSIFFKQKLTPDQLIIINEMGEKVGPETPVNRDLKPTSETVMHLQSYRLRPDVMGIVHAHPSHCVALTAAGKKVRSQVLTEANVVFRRNRGSGIRHADVRAAWRKRSRCYKKTRLCCFALSRCDCCWTRYVGCLRKTRSDGTSG